MDTRSLRIFPPDTLRSRHPRRRFFSLFPFILTILLAAVLPLPALAQAQIVSFDFNNHFGEAITFTAKVQSDSPVRSAQILIRKQGQPDTVSAPAEVSPGGELKYRYDLKALQPGQYPPRAFSKITVMFQGTLENGETFTSTEFVLDYVDNRFSWKEKESGSIHVHWYLGDDPFAQEILDAAGQGLKKAQEFLPLEVKSDVNIYVYANASDMQAALLAGQNWVAGQAAPDLSVSVVSLLPERPDTRLEINRQIPHELMHILLYQYAEKGYGNLPTWFNEGLATMTELSPNPDYQTLLEAAVRNNTLIPVASLCGIFPGDTSAALLAYAESSSFTSFLYRQYGASGLEKLVGSYTDGLDCQRGVEMALGSSLDQLEDKWLEEALGVNALGKAFRELLPWIALFSIVVLVPLLLTIGSLFTRRNAVGLAGRRNPGQVPANPLGR